MIEIESHHLVHTPAPGDNGYRQRSTYDQEALRWCEVLNTLHFAYWSRKTEPAYTSFALDRAIDIAGLGL